MPFFLNIVVEDKDVAVRNVLEAHENVVVKHIPFLNTVATELVTENRFSVELAKQVVVAVPAALEDFGVTAMMETKYVKGGQDQRCCHAVHRRGA